MTMNPQASASPTLGFTDDCFYCIEWAQATKWFDQLEGQQPLMTFHPRKLRRLLYRALALYLLHFRPLFPNATEHAGMWPYKDRPMTDKMIRRCVRRHTAKALGYAVTPHRFRNAAATFTSVVDPKNIRMAKDLLGHSSLFVTEQHYVDGSRSRLAGRQHAEAWATLLNRLEAHNANKLMR